MTKLAVDEIARLDPYKFRATIGERIIHPGGRASTATLLAKAGITASSRVLDVGCGVGTHGGRHRSHGAHVTAVDIAPLMLERAKANVAAAGLSARVEVEHGDILDLKYEDNSFDVVIAEPVTMFVERSRAASELARVATSGGRVLATEFFWRQPPTPEAREIFLGQVCPGLEFDTVEYWVRIYESAGLTDLDTVTGPFEMMTPRGFLSDEGVVGSLAIMGRVASRPANVRKMAWLMPRMAKAVRFLGYIVVAASKPG